MGDHDRMEKLDAWGICPAVLDRMAELGMELIVVYDRSENAAYTTTREEVLEHGILCAFKPGALTTTCPWPGGRDGRARYSISAGRTGSWSSSGPSTASFHFSSEPIEQRRDSYEY
jgi:hypothetical protein